MEYEDGKQKEQCYRLEKEVEMYKRNIDKIVEVKERLE
jgi:hypothetical protein